MPNVNTGLGIASGLNQAAQNVQQGIVQGYDIKTRRDLQAREQSREDVIDSQRAVQVQQTTEAFNQASDIKDLQIQQMQMQLKQLTDDSTKKETYSSFDGYRESGGDVKYLNNLVKNPRIKSMMNGANGIYKVDPVSDIKLLNRIGLTEEDIAAEGFDPTRYVKTTRDGGEPGTYDVVDLYGAYAKTGYMNVMKKEDIQDMAMNQAKLNLRKSEAQTQLAETTTEDVIGWLEANPDKTYTDYKNQGKVGRDSRGGTEKLIATYDRENPSASTEERKAFVDNLFKTKNIGVGGVREEKDVADLTRNQLKAIDLVDSTKYDSKEALKLENNIMSDLGTTKKKQVGKALEALTANHKMVKSITRILKEAEAGPVKIDKDVIANAKTYVQTIFGDDTPQAFKNIDFNTAGGLLLAGFMKDVSGTAVGVAEAERLTRLFQGGNLADETFVKEAMSAFARESEEANNILRDNNKQYIPESATRLTTYEDKVEEPAQQAIPTGTVEDGYRFLGGNPADQNNWEKVN